MPTLAMTFDVYARDRASATFARIGTSAEGAGLKAESSAKRMKHFAEAVGAIAVLEVGKKMIEAAGNFQQGTNVLVTAAGESVKNLGMVRKGIMDISVGTGTPLKDLTDGMYQVEKAGFRGGAGLTILKAAAQGAREEGANLSTVTSAMTSTMQSYHLPASKSVMVMNELKAAAGESKTTMEEFAGSLSTVLPIASANHISFAQVAGSLATLTQHGTSAKDATHELAATIRNLAAPNMVAIKEMGQLGISSQDVSSKLGQRGVAGSLNYLSETVLRKMGPSGKVLLNTFLQSQSAGQGVTTMLGAMTPATRALAEQFIHGSITSKGWVKALGGMTPQQASLARQFAVAENKSKGFNAAIRAGMPGSQTYTEAIKKMTGGAIGLNTTLQLTGESTKGTTERIKVVAKAFSQGGKDVSGWASTQKLFNVQMDMLKERVQVIAVQIGTALIPKVLTVAKAFGSLLDWIQKNSKWLKPLAANALLFAAGIVVITKAMNGWKAAQEALNAVFKANPFGLAIAAVSALAVGIIYLYNHNKTFHDDVVRKWNSIKILIHNAWNQYIKPALESFSNYITGTVVPAVSKFWTNTVKPTFLAIGGWIASTWTKTIWPALKAFAGWITGTVAPAISSFWTHIVRPTFQAIGGWIAKTWTGTILPALRSFAGWVTGTMVPTISNFWNKTVKPTFASIGKWIALTWNLVIKPALAVFGAFIKDVLIPIIKLLYNAAVKPILTAVGAVFVTAWKVVIKPALTAWVAFFNNVLFPVIRFLWNYVAKPVFKLLVSGFLALVSTIIHGAATMFGWVPGVGPKLRDAAAKFDTFKNDVNRALGGVLSRSVTVTATASFRVGTGSTALNTQNVANKLKGMGLAYGGPVQMPGAPDGVDAIPLMGMKDEHMWTTAETKAVGGHSAMFRLRSAALRGELRGYSGGGPIVHPRTLGLGQFRTGAHAADQALGALATGLGAGIGRLVKDAIAAAKAAASGGGGTWHGSMPAGGAVTRWASTISRVLRELGGPAGALYGIEHLISAESGGNPNAINLTDSNARAGHPSRGLMQTIPTTFAAYAGPYRSRGIYDPLANIYAGTNYAHRNYGWSMLAGGGRHTNSGAYLGYDEGGVARGKGWMPKHTIAPERVLAPHMTKTFDKLVMLLERNGAAALANGRGPLVHVDRVDATVDLELIARHAEFRERRGSFS